MRRLLKSKKGGIPAINEIVITFLGIIPKPIKILLFILLLTTLSAFVIPTILNLFGYACVNEVGSLELYQMPMTSLVQKTGLDIKRAISDILTTDEYQLPEDPHPNGDKRFLRIPAECFVEAEVNGSSQWGYTALCTDCEASGGFYTWKDGEICLGDGERNYVVQSNRKAYCRRCKPPDPYFYDHSFCLDPVNQDCYFTVKNETDISLIGSDFADFVYLENILNLGGVRRQQDSSEIINIQCSDVAQPNLFVFSIELFNRTMWIFLIIGWFLISFAYMYYGIVLR